MNNKKYDLEDRTFNFSKNIILLCKQIDKNIINESIIKQLIRSSTSIGANYTEANGASIKKDFKNKIYICKKETMETKYWIRLLLTIESNIEESLKTSLNEAHELTLIFSKIISTMNSSPIKISK